MKKQSDKLPGRRRDKEMMVKKETKRQTNEEKKIWRDKDTLR
jgi:hypothetical protein